MVDKSQGVSGVSKKTGKLKSKIIWACIILAVVFFAKGCFKKNPPKVMPARPVETAVAFTRDVPIYIDSFGNLIPPNDVNIKSQVTGAIKEVNFTEGSEVKTKDLLFTIDPAPFEAQLDKAKAALMGDAADLSLQKSTFERNKVLFEKNFISQQDFDQYKANLSAAEAKVNLDNAEIDLAKINLAYCFIHSPVDGLAGKQLVDIGNIVTANSGPTLVNIKTIDTLFVDFTISEASLDDIRRAMGEGKLKVEVTVGDDESTKHSGELELLDNTVDNTTGTVLLRARVSNSDRALWAGQFVRVRLILSTKKDAVLVPYDAVQLGQKGSYLFTVTAENKADLRLVKPGSKQQDFIVVNEGIKSGEKVVTSGQLGLAPGAPVVDVAALKAMEEKQAAGQQKNKKK